jgi:hypothetical protein
MSVKLPLFGKSSNRLPGVPPSRLHPPHATKALFSQMNFPDRLLDVVQMPARTSLANLVGISTGLPSPRIEFLAANSRFERDAISAFFVG